jgi:transcriptional regulator with XRE-family HTH domain
VYRRFTRVDGDRLRQLRQEQSLSLRDLAEITGIAFDTINKLELGRRDAQPRTIRKLAQALGVEPKLLMKGDQACPPEATT